ncbi:MAG: hypothetical protein NDF57_04770 [archaeon GBS-70-058]|nr:hypothetical protein [Candidatus Culexarchaeum nevadense]
MSIDFKRDFLNLLEKDVEFRYLEKDKVNCGRDKSFKAGAGEITG